MPKAVRIVSLIRRVVNASAGGVASRQRLYHPVMAIWPVRRALDRLHSKDPDRDGLRRAIRAAIVVPLAAGFGRLLVGGTAAPLFAVLGAYWLMVVTDFPGNRQNRAVAYLGLGLNGSILIVLGTLVTRVAWLAVMLTLILGVAVTLAGALSETMSAGKRTTLLCFVWPVCTPAGPAGERLVGWLIALALCVPASLFLLPPRHHDALRRNAAQVCAALADRIEGIGSTVEVSTAMDRLRATFLAASSRPVGLTAGSRALMRVVDHLGLVSERVDDDTGTALGPAQQPAPWSVMRCCATSARRRTPDRPRREEGGPRPCIAPIAVAGTWSLPPRRQTGPQCARQPGGNRNWPPIADLSGDRDNDSSGRQPSSPRQQRPTPDRYGRGPWAYDCRPPVSATGYCPRLSPLPPSRPGFCAPAPSWRATVCAPVLGLALAVAVSHLFPVLHGFWVVLGTMAVLASSALVTRTKMVQAVIGAAVGVTVAALLIAAFTIAPAALWSLLPIAVFGSAYLPRLFSFAVAQAVTTLTTLIILDLMVPTGWRIGLLRIEDVVMGAGVGMVVSLLLWPRGAIAAISAVISAALDVNVPFLRAAVRRVTRENSDELEAHLQALSREAMVVSRTVDDAVRQYLSETGSGANLRTPVVRSANRAMLVRTAGDMIADIKTLPPSGTYPFTRALLETYADSLGDRLSKRRDATEQPVAERVCVRSLRAEATGESMPVEAAQPLVAVAATLSELELVSFPTSDSGAADRSPVG